MALLRNRTIASYFQVWICHILKQTFVCVSDFPKVGNLLNHMWNLLQTLPALHVLSIHSYSLCSLKFINSYLWKFLLPSNSSLVVKIINKILKSSHCSREFVLLSGVLCRSSLDILRILRDTSVLPTKLQHLLWWLCYGF